MAELTCAQKLAQANTALHNLNTGQQMVEVGYGERRVKYSQVNIGDLRAYIQALELECGSTTSRARRPFGVRF